MKSKAAARRSPHSRTFAVALALGFAASACATDAPMAADAGIDDPGSTDAGAPADAAYARWPRSTRPIIDCVDPEPPAPGIDLSGGSALQAGRGGNAGTLSVRASLSLQLHSPEDGSAIDVPAVPDGGLALTTQDLAADVARPQTVRLGDHVLSDPSDTIRSISSLQGDVIVEGALRSTDLAPTQQGISITAPSGTVYVTGTIDTRGGTAHAGGAIHIEAREVVIAGGSLLSAGRKRCRTAGGDGGAITIRATEGSVVFAEGVIDSRGGDGDDLGGNGGDVILEAAQDVALLGVIDASGGSALDHSSRAGDAGDVTVGGQEPTRSVRMSGPLRLRGGNGAQQGGPGGEVALRATGGDIELADAIDVSGGDARAEPGSAGAVETSTGPVAGAIQVTGPITGRGGASLQGGSGGDGASIWMEATSLLGDVRLHANSEIDVMGGQSVGAGPAGAGGTIDVRARDGAVVLGGTVIATGGEAMDSGAGGGGGQLYVWSDTNANGIGGDLTVTPQAWIDMSGGAGATGGSGRSNGGNGTADFPVEREEIAVLLNSETVFGPPVDGRLSNQGTIVVRGGASHGSGGDVIFHGRRPNGTEDPVPGTLILDGNGNGLNGDSAME